MTQPSEPTKEMEVMAVRLRKLRERRRMSRKTLGECCGISKNMIGCYERGEHEPTASVLIQICDFFEVSADYLLGRKNFL